MFDLNWTYAGCIANSEKVAWNLDDIFPKDTELDFDKPFLPEQLALVDEVDILNDEEKKKLNQISGNTYLHLFGFVEEYILANTVQYANAEMFGDRDAVRALCRFADEEAKHMLLFGRYRKAFNRGFGHSCPVLESAVEVAEVIMQKSPISVLMLTLHIEFMTQQHYTECVKDNKDIDPLFSKLLKCHWLEEAQHAKIDALELEKLAMAAEGPQIEEAVSDYLDLLAAFDGLLRQQAEMDTKSLAAVTGRKFTDEEVNSLIDSRMKSYRKTFIVYGMTNPMFVKIMNFMSSDGSQKIADKVPAYS